MRANVRLLGYLFKLRCIPGTRCETLKKEPHAERIATGPVVSVLEMADRILGSLFKVWTQLEPVKELKETLESKIKHWADREIIDLMKAT